VLSWAKTSAEGAVMTPAKPGAKVTSWATKTSAEGTAWTPPTAWAAKSTSGAKWAAWAFSLTGQPGGRPAFPVRFLGGTLFLISFQLRETFAIYRICLIKQCDISFYSNLRYIAIESYKKKVQDSNVCW